MDHNYLSRKLQPAKDAEHFLEFRNGEWGNWSGCGGGGMTMWLVRAGRAGEKEQQALEAKAAMIGWEELPDLTPCATRDELQTLLRDTYPEERVRTLISWLNQIWPVRDTMRVGDLVALPLKTRPTIAFGTVSGGYTYRQDLPGGPQHARPVEWLAQIPRSAFDPDMLFSFGLS